MFENKHKLLIKSLQHNAFSLAEVLITLAIIGVVAALTVPGLLQDTNDAQYKAAAKEAYSILNQALNMMKLDEPDVFGTHVLKAAKP